MFINFINLLNIIFINFSDFLKLKANYYFITHYSLNP